MPAKDKCYAVSLHILETSHHGHMQWRGEMILIRRVTTMVNTTVHFPLCKFFNLKSRGQPPLPVSLCLAPYVYAST